MNYDSDLGSDRNRLAAAVGERCFRASAMRAETRASIGVD
jgi:hypothetical protein